MTYIPGCVFCKIVWGEEPATFIQKTRRHIAITPNDPHVPGHVLFIPANHIESAVDDPWAAGRLFGHAAEYARVNKMQCNILTSAGAAATQTVPHLHLHVLPRGFKDGLDLDWPWMRETSEK